MQVHATYAKLKKFYGIIDSFNLDAIELITIATNAGEKRKALQKEALELARCSVASSDVTKFGYELLILILPGYPTIFNRIKKIYDDFVPLVAIAFSKAFTAS